MGWPCMYALCAACSAVLPAAGRPLFEGPLTDSDILGMLLGIRPLPFEEDPTLWVLFSHHQVSLPPGHAAASCWHHTFLADQHCDQSGCVTSLHSSQAFSHLDSSRSDQHAYGAEHICGIYENGVVLQAAHLVQGLLSRRPEERLTAQAALAMAEQL